MIDLDKNVIEPLIKTFGKTATYQPSAGGSFSLKGVFDEAYHEVVMMGDGPGATTEAPVFGVRLADFPVGTKPLQGDTLTIQETGTTYSIREVRPDGHGYAKLMLNFKGNA